MAKVQQLTPAEQAAQMQQQMVQANAAARALVNQQAYPMIQSIFSGTYNPAQQAILNIAPQNVGLILGFFVEIVTSVTNAATNTATLTKFANANVVQNVTFTDLQNYQRINTTGRHLHFLNTAKQGRPFMSSTASDSPVGYGSNWTPMTAPATLAASANGTLNSMFYVPISYGAKDLTGAIYAGVVNATMNLQLTLANSAQAFIASGDPLNAIFTGNTGTVVSHKVTVYQHYLDQLPVGKQGIILPMVDLNTIYELKTSTQTGMAVNLDFPVGYSNFRHFLSTFATLDNGGTFNSGSDVNYFAFQTANYTNTKKCDPNLWAGMTRQRIMTDYPPGVYYFDTRDKPIYTTQTGNTTLVLNANTLNTNAALIVDYEMLSNANNLVNAGALSSAG